MFYVIGRADVDVPGLELLVDVGGDGLGLGDLLGDQLFALQHVLEVHIAAHVQLIGAVDGDAALFEEAGQHPVGDGGADLRLDVVADDGQARVGELLGPLRVGGDEDRQAVDEGAAGVDGALGVEPVSLQ